MRIDILTIFPEIFHSPFDYGIIRRARQEGLVSINIHNLRDFTYDKHQVVDDRPFGGGEGMVLKPEPIFRAVEYLTHRSPEPKIVVFLTPQGKRFDQNAAKRLASYRHIVLICGRYEGVDERVQSLVDEEISIGDYVLSGGEFAAMVVTDSIVRLIPKAVGCSDSTENESFSSGILDCPVYTRPAVYRGLEVPEVLQRGNHREIAIWRRHQALKKTLRHRPDLLQNAELSDSDRDYLKTLQMNSLKNVHISPKKG